MGCRASKATGQDLPPAPEKSVDKRRKSSHTAALSPKLFSDSNTKVQVGSTYGLIKVVLHEAKLAKQQSYYAVVSIGSQSFLTKTVKQTATPVWGDAHNLVLQKGGATRARIAVYSAARKTTGLVTSKLVAVCDIDLASYFDADSSSHIDAGWHDLRAPSDSSASMGQIRISAEAASLESLEVQFWKRILAMADLNGDHVLSVEEFKGLLQAFGNTLTEEELHSLFAKADRDKDGLVDESELARLLATEDRADLTSLLKRCPVTGAELTPGDDWSNLIYMTLMMDEGTGQLLQGGFTTADHGSRAWMLKLSEWATQPLVAALPKKGKQEAGGLRVGRNADHILVYDRASKRIVEERIAPYLIMAMRNMYQSPVGVAMMRAGAYRALQDVTDREGKHMNSPASVKEIPKFLSGFEGELDMSEVLEPVGSFKNFNEFFYRKLKAGARPVAQAEHGSVVVSAADARLITFDSVDAATRLWIKGRHFSVAGLLADTEAGSPLATAYEGGTMVIFRLAPQDYHRFHFPVSGTLRSLREVPGKLYTVNPIAVNSTYTDVFTENKRAVCMIDTPEFGEVAFVAIGATMVGSINFTAKVGKAAQKGDELGFFAFGGSTTIALFKKGMVVIDQDLVVNSNKSLETLVKMGERVGVQPGSHFMHSVATTNLLRTETLNNTLGVDALSHLDLGAISEAGGSAEFPDALEAM
ncbi:hypothetical protein WJX72_001112 [[Myrmecia] bisecta]|uniref:Phosphatidylserine decarboxylase proenzyme 2 n=1 Tax=[Myrmecia] bisecta TaxID=41462 RepID=A0AAW1PHD9_9CHLO